MSSYYILCEFQAPSFSLLHIEILCFTFRVPFYILLIALYHMFLFSLFSFFKLSKLYIYTHAHLRYYHTMLVWNTKIRTENFIRYVTFMCTCLYIINFYSLFFFLLNNFYFLNIHKMEETDSR